MSFYIAVSSFWTLCWCTKPNPQTLTPEISSRPEMSSWSILQSDITLCFTPLWRMMKWPVRVVTAIRFTSALFGQGGEQGGPATDGMTQLQNRADDEGRSVSTDWCFTTPVWVPVSLSNKMCNLAPRRQGNFSPMSVPFFVCSVWLLQCRTWAVKCTQKKHLVWIKSTETTFCA